MVEYLMVEYLMWVVSVIAIVGFFLNMRKSKWGYVIWFISNVGFAVYNLYMKSYAETALWVFYSGMCVYGFMA